MFGATSEHQIAYLECLLLLASWEHGRVELAEYRNIYALEDTHYYYNAVHDLVQKLLLKNVRNAKNLRILDAGCGTGGLSTKLAAYGTVTGVDAESSAIAYALERGVKAIQGSVEELPFSEKSFDVVISIDVLYHQNVVDDEKALREFYNVLAPGGALIVRVPAKKELFCLHDKFVHTKRRYELDDFRSKLVNSGFAIVQLSYCQSLLYLPALIKASIEKLITPEVQHNASVIVPTASWVNRLSTRLLRAENWLISAGFKLPIGIGLIAICRKQ